MDEGGGDGIVRLLQAIERRIEEGVAHEPARAVGEPSGDAGGLDGLRHVLYGQGGKEDLRPAGDHGLVLGLVPLVIRDPGHHLVDPLPFRGHRAPAGGETDHQHRVRLRLVHGGEQSFRRAPEGDGQLPLIELPPAHGLGQGLDRLPGGVHSVPAEGGESGDQQSLHLPSLPTTAASLSRAFWRTQVGQARFRRSKPAPSSPKM